MDHLNPIVGDLVIAKSTPNTDDVVMKGSEEDEAATTGDSNKRNSPEGDEEANDRQNVIVYAVIGQRITALQP